MLKVESQEWSSHLSAPFPNVTLLYVPHLDQRTENTQPITNNRSALRHTLKSQLDLRGFTDTEPLLALEHLPTHIQLSISLSHTMTSALIGWIKKPYKIGVDIELMDRISMPIIQRVSTTQEIHASSDPRSLWCAKESVFKALHPQVQVLSDISIFDWKTIDTSTWSFRARKAQSDKIIDGEGLIRFEVKQILSFFICT